MHPDWCGCVLILSLSDELACTCILTIYVDGGSIQCFEAGLIGQIRSGNCVYSFTSVIFLVASYHLLPKISVNFALNQELLEHLISCVLLTSYHWLFVLRF